MLLLLLQIQRVLLHERLQLRWTKYVLLQQLLHLMEAAWRAEHHLRGGLRRRSPGRATGWRALGRIRRRTPLRGLRALMRARLRPWRPRTGLLRLLCDDRLLLLGHGCCCHCVSSGTELPIALILDGELLLLLLLLRLISNTAATAGLGNIAPAGVTTIARRLQAISVAALPLSRQKNAVARLLLLQGCKQRGSLQYENGNRELDQSLLQCCHLQKFHPPIALRLARKSYRRM